MKAIVNIGLRSVELEYSIKQEDKIKFDHRQSSELFGKDWSMFQKRRGSNIVCKQTIWFKDFDDWKSILLFDGKTIDFHYDYHNRKDFDSRENWKNYLFQGYEYKDGEPQMYDYNVVKKIIIKY